ncbi:hypothetical protein BZG36_00428 [Bifiguratus adelaidae]|uniref:L-lactate dehydrogenase n=1 Tax=Bifiguratus adelaidae TaxID=1938954 RepID=A0A261Y842_9FUNG|nr:hypothetical protein BZG36_00428 [Bifiguratus adelaidae]
MASTSNYTAPPPGYDAESAPLMGQRGLLGNEEPGKGVPVAQAPTEIRMAFVRKVYSILSVQLLGTVAMSALFMYNDNARSFVQHNMWVVIVSMIGTFITLFALMAKARQTPINYYLLALFTVLESIGVGTVGKEHRKSAHQFHLLTHFDNSVSFYEQKVVLQALLITLGVFVGLTLFTVQSKWDFSGMGPILYASIWILVLVNLVEVFLPFNRDIDLAIAVVAVVIFSGYIIFDTYLIFNRYSPEDYIIAASRSIPPIPIDIMVQRSRVAIIGAGSVGATIAYACLLRKVCSEILLVDIAPEIVNGQVLDLADAAFLSSTVVRGATFEETGQCDIIVITAGAKQNQGESRTQLIKRNHKILNSVISSTKPLNKHAIILLVANPVDILTHIAQKLSGLPRNQVFGSGTYLDSGRLRLFLSQLLGVSETAIHAYTLGEHGDSQFVAWSSARVGGKPLMDFPEVKNLDHEKVEYDVAHKAYEIIKLKGATYFGIGACVASLCQTILLNQRHVRPLSVYVERLGVTLSMPAVLGTKGVEEILEVPLNEKEKKLMKSVHSMKQIIDKYD